MRAQLIRRSAGALAVGVTLVITASCTSDAVDPTTMAPPSTYATLDAFVTDLDLDLPVIETTFHSGQIRSASPTARIWSDGRYSVIFGTAYLPFGVESDTALADVVVEGRVDQAAIDTYLTALKQTDVADLARLIESTECGEVVDAGTELYTLAAPTTTRQIRPCAGWSHDEYPSPLDLAAELASAALDDQSDLVWAYRNYGGGLHAFDRANWDEKSLVIGTIARINVAEPRLAFEVDEVLVGSTEPRRYALVGEEIANAGPDELAVLEKAQPGDRVMALVGPETDVSALGFLDRAGALVITDASRSVLSLGHLGFVAAEQELFLETGVECELSDSYRPDPAGQLSPRDALIEIATREFAIDQRNEWVSEARAALLPGTNLVWATVTGIGTDEIAIITDDKGGYVTHARQAPRPDNRDTRTLQIWVPEGPLNLQVWIVLDELVTGCGAMEFGPLAPEFGDLVATIATVVEEDVPDPSITVNVKTGDFSIEP